MDFKNKNLNTPIAIVSIAVPLLVAFLFYGVKTKVDGFENHWQPLFHAVLNGTTALLLILSLYAIKNGNIKVHKTTNLIATVLSVVFLLSYVIYHGTNPSTKFEGTGAIKYIYYFVLLTHILLAAIVLPFVLLSLSRAFQEKFDKHKKISKITWPLWFYVAVTGVVVYIMIAPYYK